MTPFNDRSFAFLHLALFHASLQTCQLQKQTDPAKTGLVRYLVSKSHGSETCNCRVQRVFFLPRVDHNRSFATKKNPLAPRVGPDSNSASNGVFAKLFRGK